MQISEFLTTSFQNVRSSKRTDQLHKVLLDEVLNANPEWAEYTWEFEYQLPVDGFGGTFDVDIAGFSEGQLKVAILAKLSIATSTKISRTTPTLLSVRQHVLCLPLMLTWRKFSL